MSTGHRQERDQRQAARQQEQLSIAEAATEKKAAAPEFMVLACVRKIVASITMILGFHLELAFPGGIGSLPGETEYDQAEAHLTQHSLATHIATIQREAGHLTKFIDDENKRDLPGTVERVSAAAGAVVAMTQRICEQFQDLHPQMVAKLAVTGQGLGKLHLRMTEIDLIAAPLITLASS